MNYIKVKWIHSFPDMPVWMYIELDEERWEQRKVEVFADGHIGYADDESATEPTGLGEDPVPSITEISADSQFLPEEITKEEFEIMWSKALKRVTTD